MSEFALLNIDSLGKLDRGRSRHRPRDEQSLYGGPYPFVQTGDIKHAPFYINNYSQTYSEKGLQQSRLWDKGTLCITIAANISDTAILNFDACFPDSIVGFIPYKGKSDVRFVKYCFDTYKTTFEAISKGTTQDNLSLDKIRSVKFKVPPLLIQRKIAAVLSAYDDLIENNSRRIAILEKMAEELYREWFLRMRFPGQEKTRVVKGVPEGWEVKKLGEIFKTSSGGTPSRANTQNYGGDINWVKTGELKKSFVFDTEEKISSLGLENSAAHIFPKGTVIIAMYCAMDDVSILGVPASTNQACCAFLPKESWLKRVYSYFLIKFSLKHMIGYAHGAAQQNLSQTLIKAFPILLPKKEIVDAFSAQAETIYDRIGNLMKLNSCLRKSRTALLSRLMSGKIDLEHLNIQFPPSMREEEPTHA